METVVQIAAVCLAAAILGAVLRQLAERREREDIRDRRLTGAALLSAAGLLVILLI